MSDLEWMRHRHLRRYWKRRIEEDPYKALFGASEDMLRGRGLQGYIQRQREMHKKGLEWVQKTFPKWMLEDMGLRDRDDPDTNISSKPLHLKKAENDSHAQAGKRKRESTHEELLYNAARVGPSIRNECVKSPSDTRRPQEHPHTPAQNHSVPQAESVLGSHEYINIAENPATQVDNATRETFDFETTAKPQNDVEDSVRVEKVSNSRELSFIEEFLADKAPSKSPSRSGNLDWRQTAIDRRAAADSSLEQRRKTAVNVIDVSAKDKARQVQEDSSEPRLRDRFDDKKNFKTEADREPAVKGHYTSVPQAGKVVIDFQGPLDSRVGMKEVQEFPRNIEEAAGSKLDTKRYRPVLGSEDWMQTGSIKARNVPDGAMPESNTVNNPEELSFESGQAKPDPPVAPRRSTSDVLEQLPKEDIDFLTANDIRASMGRIRTKQEDKSAIREKLEEGYQKDSPELHHMLEAQVVNGQYVRRVSSEMAQEQHTESVQDKPITADSVQQETLKPVSVLETSLDFMSRWLHTGGNVLAQHFWQDPVQLVAGQLSGADDEFFKGIGAGVIKGRRAFALIKDELIEDVPATKTLIDRLNRDEIRASAGAVKLYRDLPSALKDGSDVNESRAAAHLRVGKLRQALLDTDKQYKEACELIDSMHNTSKPTFLLEKRLRFAVEILRKNTKLTRMAVFGLQGRIEVATRSDGLVFRELLHRLLTLQDTQLALSRLVSRAMHNLGINPTAEEATPVKAEGLSVGLEDTNGSEASVPESSKESTAEKYIDHAAVNGKLQEEVRQLKDAMHGLSDDGYKHPPKPFIRKSFDEPNPLAHSLFRPFSLQLDSLGKETDAEKEGVISAAKKEKGDTELVREVRKAYEDVYGPITASHWQVQELTPHKVLDEEPTKVPESKESTRKTPIQMLKEDNVSPSIATEAPETDSVSFVDENVQPLGAVTETTLSLRDEVQAEVTATGAKPEDASSSQPTSHNAAPTSQTSDGYELAYEPSTDSYVPISYKTLIYNSETDKLSITTSQVPQPNPPITPIPLHEALATLSHPSKFIDHLPASFHVLAAKPDVLTLQTASPSSTIASKNVTTALGDKSYDRSLEPDETDGWRGINPVDGTTTLSPTGFEGVGSDLERELEFQERRRKAQEYHGGKEDVETGKRYEKGEKRKGRVGFGGVVRTAIWAGAFCYVVGVLGEVAKGPF